MRGIHLLLVLLAAPMIGVTCSPDVRIVETGVEIYDFMSPADPTITAGEQVGIRVPLENVGNADASFVTVLAQLLDKDGGLLQQRGFSLREFPIGAQPVFDLRPFETDPQNLLDAAGMGTFRIEVSLGPAPAAVYERSFPVFPATPDTSVFEHFAQDFEPFVVYPPGGCFTVHSDTIGLLAAVELHAIDPLHALAISPTAAEAYVFHLAEQHLALNYDPQDPGGPGTCSITHPATSNVVPVLAWLLKVHGSTWGQPTHDMLRRLIHLPAWGYLNNTNVYNKSIQMPTMRLLFGEAACHEPSWDHAWNQLSNMVDTHLTKGGFESHDLHYTMYHLGNLGLLHALDSSVPRDMAHALFDLKSALAAHMYLPGGELGVLYTRATPHFFPGTERERALGPVVAALGAGSDFVNAATPISPQGVTLLTDVVTRREPLTAPIRSLFHEKTNGYETWWLQRFARSRERYPGTLTFLGEGGGPGYAWQFDVLPGGDASIGTSYGAWVPNTGNKEGAAVRCLGCEQGFAYIYQWQACNPIDTEDSGNSLFCSSHTAPEAKTSGYDAERMQVHRTRLSLFDPRSRFSRWWDSPTLPVVRGDERSLAYVTNWDHPLVGGETIFPTVGGWWVGRVGDVFIAYRPLADSMVVSQLDGQRLDGGTNVDYATLFELSGRSGGITILATGEEFPGNTLTDFAAEMDARYWSFTAAGPNDGPIAETDYRDANGQLCRMKLEYMGIGGLPGTERRYVDCSPVLGTGYVELTQDEFFAPLLDGQLMTSPYVSYDPQADVLTVDVPKFLPVTYDWGALRYPPVETPAGCGGRAYLELGEPPEAQLQATPLAPVPAVDVDLTNAGFADTTVSVSFAGDDCTAGSAAPNGDWLEPPLVAELVTTGGATTIHVSGSAAGCDVGQYAGELTFSSLEANALDTRLPVTLDVAP